VASGWSGCRVGLAPTGKRHLFTAHTRSGPLPFSKPDIRGCIEGSMVDTCFNCKGTRCKLTQNAFFVMQPGLTVIHVAPPESYTR
ncbi:hypothetical protein, partial [Caballeronia humi]|uniref:hypothetical protein n=1 Tax=Caballeronia humi TaxID=326474 RepID=UPI001F1CF46A